MEKEVVVAADVVEKEELISKVFKFVNLLWLHGLILGETLEAARKISSHQGYHEHEVSCGGEADLLRHYKTCKKNPGHSEFIPLQDFEIKHLPSGYRDNLTFDWIKAEADTTCRLKVMCTSKNRPKYYPWPRRERLLYPFSHVKEDFMRVGTGYVLKVDRYSEGDSKECECDDCNRQSTPTHTPHKVWGKVHICTATHVVYDDDEARRTTCYFGYDTRTTWLHHCLKLTGLRFEIPPTRSNIAGDGCTMTYVTHDMDIINKLDNMNRHRKRLVSLMHVKYRGDKNAGQIVPCPVVIISHPHGHSKHITVGMCTHRRIWTEKCKERYEGWDADTSMVFTSYTYNAHTCPGSSGAPILRLSESRKSWLWNRHFHSESGEGNTNNNKSGVMEEIV